jgi:predicted metal-dependent HD superfamily phosphohydrolase
MTPRDLLRRWRDLLDGDGAEEIGRDLVDCWSEPHRRYHTLDHLASVLSIVDDHAADAEDPDAVRLAVWFHDAVYDPRRTDNEDRSAALAARVLPGAGVPEERVATVTRLVRLTARHDPAPDDRDGILLCDADLAVLAGDPADYAAYAAAVRAEYAHVPDEAFRVGRASVLRDLAALPVLYRLPELRDRWEERARANLTAELRTLEATRRGRHLSVIPPPAD